MIRRLRQYGIGTITFDAFQIIADHSMVVFHVTNRRLYRRSPF